MTILRSANNHVARILDVVNHQISSPDTSAVVARSWARCLKDFRLDPAQQRPPPVLTQGEFTLRREQMGDLIACAKLEMTTLYQQLADPELAVVLTDVDGVILHLVASVGFAQDLEPLGMRTGAVWSEREAGTNGMGTCLIEGEPVAVRQSEHYFQQYTNLTCSASPIFDDRGELAAVLDVTSRSPLLQQHSLVLVGMSRQIIENRLLDERYRHAHQLHFHSRPELVYTLHEGKLVIDPDGRVLAANRSALFQLGVRALSALVGKQVDELFKTSLDEIVTRSVRASFHPVPVYRARAANRFFMVAQPPQRSPSHGAGHHVAHAGTSLPAIHQNPPATALALPAHAGSADAAGRLSFGDPQMEAQVHRARLVIARRIPVLLYGETGSGKEVFAQALHRMSPARENAFVAINCASLPETLIESELFGYRAGAFTGAHRDGRRGKIIQANGGTLFLDEIGDMPIALQARLLRVLEERQVSPLGSEAVVKVDFQLISASHRNLAELVQTGQFREDLFYRLNGIELRLPPLRDRTDRLALIRHILAEEAHQEQPPALAPDAVQALLAYSWPGNIRQLRHVLMTAIALCEGETIECRHLPPEVVEGTAAAHMRHHTVKQADAAGATASEEDAAEAEAIAQFNAIQLNERNTILALLHKHRWNVSTVARSLAVSRNTLYRKIHRLHIKLAQAETADEP